MFLKAVILFCCVLVIPLVLVVTALVRNDLPWRFPPGPIARLAHYLNNNDINTEMDSVYPELRTRVYNQADLDVFNDIKHVVTELGWEIIDADQASLSLHAMVVTGLWKFKDDVYISINIDEESMHPVNIRSKSRTGRGDLGTNTRHILDLYSALDRLVLDKQKANPQ